MTSIGTLFAFVVVSVAVLVLRSKRPDAHRPFKVAGGPIIPVLGVVSCLYLMISLSVMTWTRFLLWLDLGMLIYWFYGRTHSSLRDPKESARQSGVEWTGNLVTILGSLVTFNGAAIFLLGLLTEWGVTREDLAKWSELDAVISRFGLHVNPEIADRFGLTILGIGIVLLILGMVLRRAGRRTG